MSRILRLTGVVAVLVLGFSPQAGHAQTRFLVPHFNSFPAGDAYLELTNGNSVGVVVELRAFGAAGEVVGRTHRWLEPKSRNRVLVREAFGWDEQETVVGWIEAYAAESGIVLSYHASDEDQVEGMEAREAITVAVGHLSRPLIWMANPNRYGVEATITAYDADGVAVGTRELWIGESGQMSAPVGELWRADVAVVSIAASGELVATAEQDGPETSAVTAEKAGKQAPAAWRMSLQEAAAATMSSIRPNVGPKGKFVHVLLTGGGLKAVTGLEFQKNGVTDTGITATILAVRDTMLAARLNLAAALEGDHDVVLVTAAGRISSGITFRVQGPPQPELHRMTPTQAGAGATVSFRLYGRNLNSVTGVQFAMPANGPVDGGLVVMRLMKSSNQMFGVLTIDAAAAAGDRVVVLQRGAEPAVRTNVVLKVTGSTLPAATGISPNAGFTGRSVQVRVTGTNFVAGQTVLMITGGGGVVLTNVRVESPISLVATFRIAAAAPLGPRMLQVVTRHGKSQPIKLIVASPKSPALTSITPASGVQGRSVTVTVTGTEFVPEATTLNLADVVVSSVNVTSPTTLTSSFLIDPALQLASDALGNKSFSVSTPGGTSNALPFRIDAPGTSTTTSISAPAVVYNAHGVVTVTVTSPTATPVGNVSLTVSPSTQRTEKIFFSSNRAGPRADNFHIWMMNPDGTELQQLTFGDVNDIFPELSPDGTTLVFARGVPPRLDCPSVRILNLVTGAETPVTAAIDYPNTGYASIYATWSPDGKKMAFNHASGCGSGGGIWLIDYLPTIGNAAPLTSAGTWASWSPDGTNILYGRGVGGLYKFTFATGADSQVMSTTVYEPKYSPDGTRIVWTDPAFTFRVYTASVANPTGTQTPLTASSGFVRPAWSPDGTRVTMWNHVVGGIWTINVDGNNLRRLTSGSSQDSYPWWGMAAFVSNGGSPMSAPLTNGSATFTIPSANAGNYSLSASYAAQGNFLASSATGTLQVNPRPVTVTADAQTKVYGTADPPLTYKVTSGSLAVSSDSFTGSLTRDPGENEGTYAIRQGTLGLSANYELTFAGANFTISRASTTTAVTSSQNPSTFGQSVTFTATVLPSTATGTVQFQIDGVNFGALAEVISGSASSAGTLTLAAGNHTVTAVYSGDSNFLGSTGTLSGGQTIENVPPTPLPSTGWTTLAAMPTARNGLSVATSDGLIYAAGGWNGGHLTALEVYNPSTNTWTTKNSMLGPQTHAAAGMIDGVLYMAGGTNCCVETNTFTAYDTRTNQWMSKPSMPTVRQGAAGGVVNGKLYVAGGINSQNVAGTPPLNTLEAFDPGANTWSSLAPMPTARSFARGAAVNGIFYVVGGTNNSGDLATVEAYNPATNTWTTKAPMPTPRLLHGVVALDGILYAIGGIRGGAPLSTVEAYDPATNTWSTVASMPTPRGYLNAAATTGTIYVPGGYDGTSNGLATLESFTPASTGVTWFQQFGTSGEDVATGSAWSGGKVLVTGFRNGQGGLWGEAFVRVSDDSGNLEWERGLGGSQDQLGGAVARDTSGNVYVAGSTVPALPGQVSAGGQDAFLRKYNASGTELWSHQFGGSSSFGQDGASDLALDSAGNAIVVGLIQEGNALPGQTSAGGADAFVRKYDPNGNELWTRQFGTPATDTADRIAADAAGNIYIFGRTTGTLPGQTSAGGQDVYLRKYDANGNEQWTLQFGTSAQDDSSGVAVDSSGNIVVSGQTFGEFSGQTSSGSWDLYVRKYDSNRNALWTRQFGTSGVETGGSLALDAAGNVFVAGTTGGAFPGQTSAGGNDIVVRKYDADGTLQSTLQFGSTSSDSAGSVTIDTLGRLYVAGYTSGTLPRQTSAGGTDAFVAKIAP